MVTRLTVFLILFVSITGQILATEVSGDVWGTWSPAGNPYLVTGDLRVPPESSLVILPGCRIEFQGHFKLSVDSLALFRAIGTETDSIIFTNPDTLEGWHGLRLYWADSACALSYCRLEWGRAANHQEPDTLTSYGGAVLCVGGGLAIENSRLQFNRAWEGYGGAVYAAFCALAVRSSTLVHNRAGFGGAAVYARECDVLIEGCDVSRDTTFYLFGGEHGGGAIGCFNSTVLIQGNAITSNFCGQAGGGLSIGNSMALVTGNFIGGNEAPYFGGGLGAGGGHCVISKNLIVNNAVTWGSACAGGGIACGNGVRLENNVIALNYSYWRGGGIRYYTNTTPDTFANNIIWGNDAYFGDPQIHLWAGSAPPVMLFNDVQGGWPGTGNIDLDPLFRDTANGDFRLMATACSDLFDSPGIDAGDPAIFDDSLACAWGLGTMRSDMGAYGGGRANPDAVGDEPAVPNGFVLLQNYPNPFNSSTTISFSLAEGGDAALEVFDILGRKVETLHEGWLRAGSYKVTWDATDAPSGIYFMRMTAGGREFTRSAVLLK